MVEALSFFPIGDFHIESMEQAEIFSDYLNRRPEDFVVLLGDIVHFANSIWNPSEELSIEEKITNIPKDVSIREKFIEGVNKKTIYYLGTHETFALKVILKSYPALKPKIISSFVYIPKDLQIIKIGSKNSHICVTGLHIPDNIHPKIKSEKFLKRKELVEKWIENKLASFNIKNPEKTYVCTHDPTDSYYTNMGYNALTKMLAKFSPKAHYHAHIHSNIRKTVVGKTPSINRSFVALSKLDPEALEPTTTQIRSLYDRHI